MDSKEIVKLLRRYMFSDTLMQMAADKIEEFESEINRQKAEIERLQKYNTEVAFKHYKDGMKDFAERFRAKKAIHFCKCGESFVYTDLFNGEIDSLLKEMESESK